MNLDHKSAVLAELDRMAVAGACAHAVASESDGLTGVVRDMLYGLNSCIGALIDMVDAQP